MVGTLRFAHPTNHGLLRFARNDDERDERSPSLLPLWEKVDRWRESVSETDEGYVSA